MRMKICIEVKIFFFFGAKIDFQLPALFYFFLIQRHGEIIFHWFLPHKPKIVWAGPGQNQEPRSPFGFPMCMARAQALHSSTVASQSVHAQKAKNQKQGLGLECKPSREGCR